MTQNEDPQNQREPLLKLRNVHKYFGHVHAVKGVDMDVYRGQVLAFLGDNGAGKSTIIKILSGVFKPSRGEIYFDGSKIDLKSVNHARKLGIETVYQDRAVAPDLSVAENIFLNREPLKRLGPLSMIDRKKMRLEAAKLSETLDLHIDSPDQEVRFCSGGELQGIAIARAMYFKAPLVILDEPTTALAISGIKKVLSFIEKLRSQGVAVIFVSHNIHDAYEIADSFVLMRQGHVVARRTKEQITYEEVLDLLQKNIAIA